MIPTWSGTLAAAGCAAAFFTTLGLPLARMSAPAGVAPVGLAATIGWAVFSAVSLPILGIVGFDRPHVLVLAAASLAACWGLLPRGGGGALLPRVGRDERLPPWALPLAGAAALLPMLAVLPKLSAAGLILSPLCSTM